MNRTRKKTPSLSKLSEEVRALRRDMDMFIPIESLDEYKNPDEILAAYREAKRYMARNKRT